MGRFAFEDHRGRVILIEGNQRGRSKMHESRSEHLDGVFSEARSLCSGKPSIAAFGRLLRLALFAWAHAPTETEEKLLPYLDGVLSRWPDETRCLRTFRALGTPFARLARSVELRDLILSDEDLAPLWDARNLQALRHLDLSHNMLSLSDLARLLESLGADLETFDLRHNERSWRRGFQPGETRYHWYPTFHGVRPEVIDIIAKSPRLQRVRRLGLRLPCKLPLNHNDTRMGELCEESFQTLAADPWPDLEELYLQSEGMFPRESLEPATALLSRLRVLEVDCSIPFGYRYMRAPSMPRCDMPALEELTLRGLEPGMALADASPETFQGLRSLTLEHKTITLPLYSDSQRSQPVAWPEPECFRALEALSLEGIDLADRAAFQNMLAALEHAPLRSLTLECCGLDDAKWRELIDVLPLEQLRRLRLGELRFEIELGTLEALLARCTGLEELALRGLWGSSNLARSLGRVMPEGLRALDLSGWYGLRFGDLEHVLCLPALQSVEHLTIGRQRPWDPDQTMFLWFYHPFERVWSERVMPELRTLHVGDAFDPKLLATAEQWSKLETLSFFDVKTAPETVVHILENEALEHLCDFSYLHGEFGMEALEPWREHPALANLDRFRVERKPGLPRCVTSLDGYGSHRWSGVSTQLLLDPTRGDYTEWYEGFGSFDELPLKRCEALLRARVGTSSLAEPLCDRSVRASLEVALDSAIRGQTAHWT